MSRLPTKEARVRNAAIKQAYALNVLTAVEIAQRYRVGADWVRSIARGVVRVQRTRDERNEQRAKRGLLPIGHGVRDRLVKPTTEKAATLYAKGIGSYEVVAQKLRISRNAVAGAVHRAKGLP